MAEERRIMESNHMTPEAQRIAIAEACGWTKCHATGGFPCGIHPVSPNNSDGFQIPLPDYLNDLNAMHEAEKVLKWTDDDTEDERERYWVLLVSICDPKDESGANSRWLCAHATAAQRAEAFLRTLNLWTT